MDLVVTILTIFLLIALGTIVFLINDAKKKSDSSVLSEQLEEKISNSIESVQILLSLKFFLLVAQIRLKNLIFSWHH